MCTVQLYLALYPDVNTVVYNYIYYLEYPVDRVIAAINYKVNYKAYSCSKIVSPTAVRAKLL